MPSSVLVEVVPVSVADSIVGSPLTLEGSVLAELSVLWEIITVKKVLLVTSTELNPRLSDTVIPRPEVT